MFGKTVPLQKNREDNLTRYLRECADVGGFFSEMAQVTWDFLLTSQRQMKMTGDYVEIGVLNGKSALLGALYFDAPETTVLIDINDVKPALRRIAAMGTAATKTFTGRSDEFRFTDTFRNHAGKVRWFHIDGDHSGFSTTTDINLAADMVVSRGIIVVDDFENMRYPQINAAVYRFLFARPEFRMFLISGNKVFICHAAHYALWEGITRKAFPEALRSRNIPASMIKIALLRLRVLRHVSA